MAYFVSASFDAAKFAFCIPAMIPTSDNNLGGYTIVNKYMPSFLQSAGTGVRLTLRGPLTVGSTCTISNVTISLASNTVGADPYDSAAAPTAVTFRTAASVTLARNGFALSDEISFTIDRSRPILIAYNVAANGVVPFVTGLGTGVAAAYRRAATTEAATQNRTAGYSGMAASSAFLYRLETYTV